MIAQERHTKILLELKTKSPITVAELSRVLDTSESTIRRDLIYLAEMGKLKKVHGGAMGIESPFEMAEADFLTKSRMCVEEKEKIAEYAASLIHDDDFIFVDSGTTIEKLIDYITNTKAVFVTNGVMQAKKLILKGCKAYVIGGELKLATEAIIGSEGLNSIKKYNFTKCFMGTNGITLNEGFTTPDIDEALIKTEAMNRAHVAYILADHTKFGKTYPITFSGIGKACIITDRLDDKRFSEQTVVKEVL